MKNPDHLPPELIARAHAAGLEYLGGMPGRWTRDGWWTREGVTTVHGSGRMVYAEATGTGCWRSELRFPTEAAALEAWLISVEPPPQEVPATHEALRKWVKDGTTHDGLPAHLGELEFQVKALLRDFDRLRAPIPMVPDVA